jgi:hypothetical protein
MTPKNGASAISAPHGRVPTPRCRSIFECHTRRIGKSSGKVPASGRTRV